MFLTDDQFLTAAKPLMETRYNAYVSSNGGSVDWGGGGGSSLFLILLPLLKYTHSFHQHTAGQMGR